MKIIIENINKIKAINNDKIHKETDEDYEKCGICLELLKNNVKKISCKHKFHAKCIREWQLSLQTNNDKCPICRSVII